MLTQPPDRIQDWILDERGYVQFPLGCYVPLQSVTERSDNWFALTSSRAISVASKASLLLALPMAWGNGGKHLRGPILLSLDGGSTDQRGTPDVWHRREGRQEPFGFLRSFDRSAVVAWVAELAEGKTAWFTTDGCDLWQITSSPGRDAAGRLVFDLLLV